MANLSVSVILIVKNGAEHIADALESVHQSTIQPLEVLVVDGGSTDDTVSIAQGYPTVRVVEQQSTGIPNAYNEGIAAARGDLIAFISHDDQWLPGKLDAQVPFMEARPELLLSVTHIQHYMEEGVERPAHIRPELLEKPVPGFLMETLLARPEVFDRVGGFNADFAVSEDTDWYARVKDAGIEIGVLPETFTRKRVHGGNASMTNPDLSKLLLKAMRASIQRKRAAEEGS